MATKMYFKTGFAVTNVTRGTNTAKANGSTSGWDTTLLTTTQPNGASFIGNGTNTVAGATSGVECCDNDPLRPQEYITEPLAAAVTISGTITFNVWGSESSMSANVGPQVIVERLDSQLGIVSTVVNSENGTELALTTPAVKNWTASPTSTAFNRGDRVRVRILGNDIGTMATGFTFNIDVEGGTTGADGDSWIQFNENLTFETDPPTGSQLFLTSTSAGINPGAATELEAWTSRGGGSTNSVTNTATGWTAPIQATDTGGGTALEWYSKPLTAFTLGGLAKFNVRAKVSVINTTFAALWAEIAVCAGDGTSPTVWGAAGMAAFQLSDTDAAYSVNVAGNDISVTNGQRLRFRVFIDDSGLTALVGSRTATITYNGASAAAAGDTYVTLTQTVSEFVAGPAGVPDVVMATYLAPGWR